MVFKAPLVWSVLILVGSGASFYSASAHASTNNAPSDCAPFLWKEVKNLARYCLAEEAQGRPCAEIHFISARSASFVLNDLVYRVHLKESPESDGGDLNDVFIQRDDGCRLERRNVLAYGDLIAALAR